MSNTTTTTTQQHQPPPEVQLFQYINGYQVTQITFTLTKLNIPDHLKNGPKTCKTLSNEINVPENELFRLLRAANALGLLSYHCDTQTFHLTELSTLLTENHPKSLKSATLMFGSEHYFAFGNLFKSIENGKSAFSQYYNGKTYFEYLETNKESAKVFDKTMTSFTNSFKETFVESLTILKRRKVLNNQNNQKIFVIEHLIPEKIKEKDPQSIVPCLLDLNMLVMCEGGKERTESEFKELFEKCEFKLKRVIPTKSRFVIIEGELSD
ncbi:hypothetical protein ABK040_003590 [Willaertia magna]